MVIIIYNVKNTKNVMFKYNQILVEYMPKLDISVDTELINVLKKYLKENEEIHLSGLVRKLLRGYLESKGAIKKK